MTENPTEQLSNDSDTSINETTEQVNDEEGFDDTDYIPDFIAEMIEDPPVLPGESKDAFECIFESFELNYTQRPKTDLEYFWTYQAAKAVFDLLRFDRMKAAIVALEHRPAVESLHRRTAGEAQTEAEIVTSRKSAREGGLLYFKDPEYRKQFAEKLERVGFGRHAVAGVAFERALPSLKVIERLIASAEKRLENFQKKLDLAYATREPEQPMPRSLAASRADDLAEKRVKETLKARNHGEHKATGGE